MIIRDFAREASQEGQGGCRQLVVVGLGYIGLPTAAVFASHGVRVVGVDVNARAVERINRGQTHIVEPGLEELVANVVATGMLRATTHMEPGNAFILAVPTPFHAGHVPDLTYVEAAARAVAPALAPGNLVILESTSPVGTTLQVSKWLAEARPDLRFPHQAGEAADVQVAHCPERVLPGHTLRELIHNDRIIGGLSDRCARRAAELYRQVVRGECLTTSAATAELAKLTENASRDVNIAFANELSLICDRLGVDVWELIALANRHPRVKILQPGPGVGGHCIAVDPWFIVHSAPAEARLIRTAREVNNHKPHWVLGKVKEAAAGLQGPVIGCLGLSYKPDIDDLRESPAVEIVRDLAAQQVGRVLVAEPHVTALPPELAELPVQLVTTETVLEMADVVVLLVSHRAFADVNPLALEGKRIIDTRGLWNGLLKPCADKTRRAA
jgi:UDP-N-acetyl-D-mannosaminuronic acid dehydrogenase